MAQTTLTPRETLIGAGQAAPGFTLQTQNREEWSLAEHVKNGDVVLCFFPFAFTGVCGTEMECLSKEFARWTAGGASVAGISCDSFAALKAWTEREGYTHTMLSDLHRNVCRAYGLYWADMNVATRGTVVIAQSDDGVGMVKWSQARVPSEAMKPDEVLAHLA
ncbi:MAG: redoxin domain-containing protein [Phycisphaeraceae bacterium]|nr:MAG: redoxin domain-containing protein [Phycisphaeraceae bacterium]